MRLSLCLSFMIYILRALQLTLTFRACIVYLYDNMPRASMIGLWALRRLLQKPSISIEHWNKFCANLRQCFAQGGKTGEPRKESLYESREKPNKHQGQIVRYFLERNLCLYKERRNKIKESTFNKYNCIVSNRGFLRNWIMIF